MFVISILKCFCFAYLSLPVQLNAGCQRVFSPTLLLADFPNVACAMPVVGVLLPLVDSTMANTLALAASIADL